MSKSAFTGLIVLILTGVIVLLILCVYAFSSFSFCVEFDDIKGLKVGDRVYLRGVDVGQVSDISMPVGSKVKTTLKIDKKYRKNLLSDADFFIRSDSFVLGKKCIQMHVNDESSPLIQKKQVFSGSRSWELYLLKGKNSLKQIPFLGQGIAEDLQESSPELRKQILEALAHAKGSLWELIQHLRKEAPEMLSELKPVLDKSARELRDKLPELADEIQATLEKLEKILQQIIGSIKEKIGE